MVNFKIGEFNFHPATIDDLKRSVTLLGFYPTNEVYKVANEIRNKADVSMTEILEYALRKLFEMPVLETREHKILNKLFSKI